MTNVFLHWIDPAAARGYRTGVSLHSHTSFSKETLSFVPRHTADVPFLSSGIRRLERKFRDFHGDELNYSNVWWTPPLDAHQALALEEQQIESLDMPALVSLTDHDSIEAGLAVRDKGAPVSMEWTVPSGPVFFHLGVHNLDAALVPMLEAVTASPTPEAIRDALETLDARHETLVVFNHPLWDEARVGRETHRRELDSFLMRHGHLIHAFELNGLRPWNENRAAKQLADLLGLPAISGGDRHGLEPNANLNLTDAKTFEEFVETIRVRRESTILFMPQYQEPIRLRMLRVMTDVMRDLPGSAWNDRVFWNHRGQVRRLSEAMLTPAPGVIGHFKMVMQLIDRRNVTGTLRWVLQERQTFAL